MLEFARILAGPWAGQILADLGAEVIKVESSDGDDTRRFGPPFVSYPDGGQDAAYFHATNRGKRSIVLDFSTEAGRVAARELARGADVIIENFKVGGLAKFGLDYASLSALNPRLVYCSITGFGQDGPYSGRPGYDFVIQGMSGIMDLTGEPDGPPQKIGVAYADVMTGLYATIAIQAALAERQRSGQGQYIDMALLDVMIGTLANQAMNYLVTGQSPTRLGNAHPNIVPYAAYPTSDGWFILAVGNDRQFEKFCSVVGLSPDPDWATNAGRLAHRAIVDEHVSLATRSWQRDALLARLEAQGVPAGPINSVEQAFADPQVRHRQMQTGVSGPIAQIAAVRLPIRFSRSALDEVRASPRLGSATAAATWAVATDLS